MNDTTICDYKLPSEKKYCSFLIDKYFCKNKFFTCIERDHLMTPYLSHSQISYWLQCRRKYYFRYIKGISRKKEKLSNSLKMGILWDVCLQSIHKKLPAQVIRDTVLEYEINDTLVAKIKSLYKAYKDFIDLSQLCECQTELKTTFLSSYYKDITLFGIVDRSYDDHFVESKITGKPKYYQSVFSLTSQLGTYFLLQPNIDYCILEITKLPTQAPVDNEPIDIYQKRIYNSIISRPSSYFLKFNRDKGIYGTKYYRSDFDLKELVARYEIIYNEIDTLIQIDDDKDRAMGFYKNDKGCFQYGDWCEYSPICEFNTVSEELFNIKIHETIDKDINFKV